MFESVAKSILKKKMYIFIIVIKLTYILAKVTK